MNKSDIDEILLKLYLRLNGYFTTNLIIHSEIWGQASTEIDCIGIRHAHHSQEDRGQIKSNFLEDRNGTTELLYCEVKNDPKMLEFNSPIRSDEKILNRSLQWVGIFKEDTITEVVSKAFPLFSSETTAQQMKNGIIIKNVRVRTLLCCPSIDENQTDKWCLTGPEIFQFLNKCFNPPERRKQCSTRYNFQQWGAPFYKIVKAFKNNEIKNINDLYLTLET